MNVVVLIGNLVRDPELRDAGSNKVANFVVAVNRKFNKKNGDKSEETAYVRCEAWDSGAETIAKYLKKGSKVCLQGRIKTDTWEKDGQKHNSTTVRVENFQMLDGKQVSDTAEVGAGVSGGNGEGDIPF